MNLSDNPWSAYKESLRRALSGELDQASEQEKTSAAQDVIRNSSAAAAFVAMQPLAVVDSATITPIQYKMVQALARLRGSAAGVKEVHRQVFKPLGKKIVGRNAALAGAKIMPLIPVVPHLFGVSIAYALTATIGQLSDEYFSLGRMMPSEELVTRFDDVYRQQYERTYKQKRNELKAMWGPAARRRQVGALKTERREGKLTDDQFDRRLEDLLKQPRE